MKVSIIIPFKEETGYLHECIKNCLDLDYDDFELILLPDKKINIKGKRIRVIPTGSIGPAQKRDIGSNRAKGKILAFIDDDAYPAKDWLMKVVRNFKGDIACVGGPAVTPERDNLLQKASGIVLSSRMGGGTETYRYIPGK
ncbi:MAG: glycosyltransferase, partial [Candidatus Aminicenantes bacterium]|nr:glycosyltransferase [Candidatus Aminicenantes bacterium]